jgi:hypothetical protein
VDRVRHADFVPASVHRNIPGHIHHRHFSAFLALANAALWFSPNATVPAFHLRLLDFGGLIGSCAMFLMAIVAAILHTRKLYLKEPSR